MRARIHQTCYIAPLLRVQKQAYIKNTVTCRTRSASPLFRSRDASLATHILKFDKERRTRHVPSRIRSPLPFRHEALPIHRRDPYPYEFSYANGRYIFMTESICWEPRGGQRLIALYRASPLLFFLALFVFRDSRRSALFIIVSRWIGTYVYRHRNMCGAYLATYLL